MLSRLAKSGTASSAGIRNAPHADQTLNVLQMHCTSRGSAMWKRSLMLAATAVAIVAASLPAQAPPAGQLKVSLTVLRHQDVQAFTKAQVKQILDEMGRVLQLADGPDD